MATCHPQHYDFGQILKSSEDTGDNNGVLVEADHGSWTAMDIILLKEG